MYLLVSLSSSPSDSFVGSTLTPPLAPPNGKSTNEHLKVIHCANATISSLLTSGGVIVSYLEWIQDRMGYYWDEIEVNNALEKRLIRVINEVYNTSKKYLVDLRTASYILAIERIANVYRKRCSNSNERVFKITWR